MCMYVYKKKKQKLKKISTKFKMVVPSEYRRNWDEKGIIYASINNK